ncbi:cell envelope integrity protein CreD [Neotamlana laminarinivorans]|uniref:Cell envelope integrity protein CreD n=1 Tax=Neotamlana laminarinivorans TaxID=2883124 RepID=A0A9X1L278_9FLAO|nr:cell envelope integrity protein CreD [Tamlana laminarinivorans]MCB4799515.1 cell envelope integrity protein CreD [Tamlana laminarinivorans]
MNEEQNTPQPNRLFNWLKTSITSRMLMIGFLTLVLLIPLVFIQNLIHERSYRQTTVVNEINKQWGNEVFIYGPILKVPYKSYSEKTVTDKKTKQVFTETNVIVKNAYFFSESLNINSSINPETKQRGIYKTAVYNSDINLTGSFTKPDFGEIEVNDDDILWDKAKIIIQSSNVKGVNKANLKLNKTEYKLSSKYNGQKQTDYNNASIHTLETKTLKRLNFNSPIAYNINFNIKGSKQIRFIPTGRQTEARITSNWKTANFIGEFLPYNGDKISNSGFDAKWKILDLNRPFSQQHFNSLPNLTAFSFGVNFMIPVDEYQKSERSAKYGFLVIGLTFLVFFLIQTLSKINIHPFQYLMIGLALTMFYTLLISISEHSSFLKAYLIAGTSVITLITLYSKTILKTLKFPLFIGTSLTTLYAFIYVIIQLENYALLVGSIGLFLILTTVMFISRKIDWNNG